MTRTEANAIIRGHQTKIEGSASPLHYGTVTLLEVYPNGFSYKRTTNFIELFGLYQSYENSDDIQDEDYEIAEVIINTLV